MTQQIKDRFRYRDRTYLVAGVRGEGLFAPARHGLAVRMISTACYRGFHCGYAMRRDDTLALHEVYLGLDGQQAISGVDLFGRTTARYPMQLQAVTTSGLTDIVRLSHDHRLLELDEPIPFDGSLLIATGHLEDARALTFRAGRLLDDLDGTAAVEILVGRPASSGTTGVPDAELLAWRDRLAGFGHDLRRLGRDPTRETCTIEIVSTSTTASLMTYVDGYLDPERPSERAPGRRLVHVEPGDHCIVLRGGRTETGWARESNTVNFEVADGERLRIDVALSGESLSLSAPKPCP